MYDDDDDCCYYGGGDTYFNFLALGAVFLLFLVAIPEIPIAMGGWYIGEELVGNNFAKWGLCIICFIGGFYAFKILLAKRTIYGVLFVVGQYLTLDIILSINNNRSELYTITIIKSIIAWGLSNT